MAPVDPRSNAELIDSAESQATRIRHFCPPPDEGGRAECNCEPVSLFEVAQLLDLLAARLADAEKEHKHVNPPCGLCGGVYQYDVSIPSPLWNRAVRERAIDLPSEYLCLNCILPLFIEIGLDFVADISSNEPNGPGGHIHVSVTEGRMSIMGAMKVMEEADNSLRRDRNELQQQVAALTADRDALKVENDRLVTLAANSDMLRSQTASIALTAANQVGVLQAENERMTAEVKKLKEPSLMPDDPHNWTGDRTHENGNYMNKCMYCAETFMGHKRRVVCRVCASPAVAALREQLTSLESVLSQVRALPEQLIAEAVVMKASRPDHYEHANGMIDGANKIRLALLTPAVPRETPNILKAVHDALGKRVANSKLPPPAEREKEA